MKKQKISADPQTLTSFGEPKDEPSSTASNFFKYVIDLFSPKKDVKIAILPSESQVDGASSRPRLLDLSKAGTSRKVSSEKANVPPQTGSEVELRLRSFSTFLREFPKLVKGPQSSYSGESPNTPESPTLSATELRQYWMPDEQCHECYECGEKFTTFRRRHHCRICGQIFCSRCCNQLISGKIMGHSGMLRSCMYCCKLVLRFAEGNKPDVANIVGQTQIGTDETTQEEQSFDSSGIESLGSFANSSSTYGIDQFFNGYGIRKSSQAQLGQRSENSFDDQMFDAGFINPMGILSPAQEHGWQSPGFIFDAAPADQASSSMFGSDVKEDLVKDSSQLHALWRKICDEKDGIEFRDHRFRLRKYLNCITGQELVDWLIKNDIARDRSQGCAIGQALCEGKWIKPVVDIGGVFQDGYILFQNGRKVLKHQHNNRIEIYPDHFSLSDDHASSNMHNLVEKEPIWVQEIKCSGGNGGDEVDGCYGDTSESDFTWSDAQSNIQNESLLYSDEEQSTSERSVVSLSSYVEIDEGEEVIKYTRSASVDNLLSIQHRKSSEVIHPDYDDSCLTSISADYLRNFLTWNGNCLSQSWTPPSSGWRESDLQSKAVESCDKRAFQWLREMYLRHNLAFLRQLLCEKGLDLGWAEILVPLAKHASFHINPNPNVNIDICHYVQVKKVPDGPRFESQILNGVAFTKNVAHKHMSTEILNPAILLLAIPLEYERVQLKLSALDPVVRQEREFYKHLITRVTSRRPDIVVVQCTVSRIAQELLLQAGITLIANVKPSVMERLARSTEADVVFSIDQLLQAKLGRCSRFYVKHHILTDGGRESSCIVDDTSKTLLYFDGCSPIYGCTVVLRERYDTLEYRKTLEELAKVQDVFRFLVRAMFHVRLELSYLIDQHTFGKLLKKHSSGKRLRSDSESAIKCNDNEMKNTSISSKYSGKSVESSSLTITNTTTDTILANESSNSSSQEMILKLLQHEDGDSQSSHSSNNGSNQITFESVLKTVLLSTSPLLQPGVPFLHTDEGKLSPVRKYLPDNVFQSHLLGSDDLNMKTQFSSALDLDHIGTAKSSTGEGLALDKTWLSPQQADRSSDSMDYDKNHGPAVANDSDNPAKDIHSDTRSGVAFTPKENRQQLPSCYSQQYKQQMPNNLQNVSDGPSTSSPSDINHGLYSWEQKMVDMIFGPPTSTNLGEKENFIQSAIMPASSSKENFQQTCDLQVKSSLDKVVPFVEPISYEMDEDSIHGFITCSFTQSASSEEVRDMLSSFRAHAGQFYQQDYSKERSQQESGNTVQDSDEVEFQPTNDFLRKYPAVDCLDPYSHQHICVLFNIYRVQSSSAPQFCVLPWVVNIDFYRGNDITLGGFLERYCFRPSYHCPNSSCKMPMVEHVRTFVHGGMCMSVLLKELSKPYQQSSILTWTWDHVTKKSSAIKAMSHDAWFMSFAKYLELNLGQLSIPETGSLPFQQRGVLKQDIFDDKWELKPFTGFQYFLFRDIVAAFKCFPIALHEIVFPSSVLSVVADDIETTSLRKLRDKSYDDIITVYDAFYAVKVLEAKVNESTDTIQDCIHSAQSRKSTTEVTSEEIPLSREGFFLELLASINDEKSVLLERVDYVAWLLRSNGFSNTEEFDTFEDIWETGDNDASNEPLLPEGLKKEISLCIMHLKCDISKMVQTWNEKLADAYDKDKNSFWNPTKAKSTSPRSQRKKYNLNENLKEEMAPNAGAPPLEVEVNSPYPGSQSLLRLSSANEKQDMSSVGSSDVELPEDNGGENKSTRKLKRGLHNENGISSKSSYKKMSRTGSSVKFLVTRLLPGNALVPSSPMPFPADEHYLLAECFSTNIIVRDAEPTSIIAYSLSSNEYKKTLAELTGNSLYKSSGNDIKTEVSDANSKPKPHGSFHSVVEETAIPDIVVFDNSSIGYNNAKQETVDGAGASSDRSTMHVEIQFSDTTTRFYCKAYFASLFETFRSKVLAGGEEQYIASLTRSMKWLARGGKSGSTFHKTKDDQFILKQMSYFEMQSFLEFAPKYVDHITNCLEKNEATAISKILGVYRISFRNSETGRSLKQDVLVIENLFYAKKISRIFDLKGSVRNRHVKATVSKDAKDSESTNTKEDVVLLDENLLKMMCENPIYVYEHTKHLLMSAILRDTEFLSRNLIMDYSLLVGIDENNQIIIGIIDYIRTFTWDKKLEMVVKWSSSRSMPTVVSPELYKNRFCEAMDRYFQVVPDRWYGMHIFDEESYPES